MKVAVTMPHAAMSSGTWVDADVDKLQRDTFGYFIHETNPANGLVIDKTAEDWPASIAATGLALAAYSVAVERGFISRSAAVERTLATLRFFDAETAAEREIRDLGDALYCRVDWRWAQDHGATVTHGWRPESGFLDYRWEGYDEALLLYVPGLGSPTHPLPEASYAAWTSTYRWEHRYGLEYLYAGPLFAHQLSHFWVDFRGIQDAFMRDRGIDYFENSRRATHVQQRYAIDNPLGFKDYGPHCWGISASDGPGPDTIVIAGVERQFFDYVARAVPYGRDDGTLAPWALAASLPFAPELVLPALHHCIHQAKLTSFNSYGFKASFNPTYAGPVGNPYGWWVSLWHYGLNQGLIILMIENCRTGLLWQLTLRVHLERSSESGVRGWVAMRDREIT